MEEQRQTFSQIGRGETTYIDYDGSQLCRVDYRDAICWFVGKCAVLPDGHMIDEIDIEANSPITSDCMLHFIACFSNCPQIVDVVYRQRLLTRIVASYIWERTRMQANMRVEGDDIYFQGSNGAVDRKLSVSIATITNESSPGGLIHMGINLTTKGTPPAVKCASLRDVGIVIGEVGVPLVSNSCAVSGFANEICDRFVKEANDIIYAASKVRRVD